MLWVQCTAVTRSDEAVIDDLRCAAYSSSTDIVVMTMLSESAATIRSKCEHPVVLALIFCTSERQLHKIFLHSPMKQQLMSWDLQHIASTKDVVQF